MKIRMSFFNSDRFRKINLGFVKIIILPYEYDRIIQLHKIQFTYSQ